MLDHVTMRTQQFGIDSGISAKLREWILEMDGHFYAFQPSFYVALFTDISDAL